jgi:ketosteroid isomerase-like protein
MKQKSLLLIVLLSLLTLNVAAQANPRAAIEAEGKKFTAALKKGDAAAVAAMYTADAQAMPPNEEIVQGRAAIQKLWQGTIDAGFRDFSFEVLEVEKKGDSIYEVGKYKLNGADGKQADHGKYLVVWKRQGGQWKLHRDIWNSSMPVPVTAPAVTPGQ